MKTVEEIERRSELMLIRNRAEEICRVSRPDRPYDNSTWEEIKHLEKREKELKS